MGFDLESRRREEGKAGDEGDQVCTGFQASEVGIVNVDIFNEYRDSCVFVIVILYVISADVSVIMSMNV